MTLIKKITPSSNDNNSDDDDAIFTFLLCNIYTELNIDLKVESFRH